MEVLYRQKVSGGGGSKGGGSAPQPAAKEEGGKKGDSGQVKGVGYDYQAAMGGSTSCTCPAQNKCGEELTASANLFGYAMFVA